MNNSKNWFKNQSEIAAAVCHAIARSSSTENPVTKKSICEQAGISRPTLDKLLTGSYTNESFYQKVMPQVVKAAGVNVDDLLKDSSHNNLKSVLSALRISEQALAELTGIDLAKIGQYCEGKEYEEPDLYDICSVAGCSPRTLKGQFSFYDTNFLSASIGGAYEDDIEPPISGFCGDAGILMKGEDKYRWYGITRSVCSTIQHQLTDPNVNALLFPVLEGKVIYIRKDMLLEIILLDDAADEIPGTDWDGAQRVQPAPYFLEVLDDLESECAELSDRLKEATDTMMKTVWQKDEETLANELARTLEITFTSGLTKKYLIYPYSQTNLADMMVNFYCFAICPDDDYLEIERNECPAWLPMENIARMEMATPILEKRIGEDPYDFEDLDED